MPVPLFLFKEGDPTGRPYVCGLGGGLGVFRKWPLPLFQIPIPNPLQGGGRGV